jgi:hypothetical protein
MKGTRLLALGIFLIVLIVVSWQIQKITLYQADGRAGVAKPTVSPSSQATSTLISSALPVIVLVHSDPPPLHCSISQNGISLLTESNAIAPGEFRSTVEISKGEDILVIADWKDEEPHALRVEVLVHGYQARLEKTFWAEQTLKDTLPIPDSFLQ